MKRFLAIGVAGALAPAMFGACDARAEEGLQPGSYVCQVSRYESASVGGQSGSVMMLVYDASALGMIELDEGGRYRTSRGDGAYRVDVGAHRVIFADGPLKDWPAVFVGTSGVVVLRLAPTKDGSIDWDRTRVGEHRCAPR